MARRNEHSQEEIKNMVLRTAESIVSKEGYAALNTRKIAAKIGYTVGSIYMVFTNMADLTLHLKASTLDDITMSLNAFQQSQNPELEKLAIAYLDFAANNFNRWAMLFDLTAKNPNDRTAWYQQKIDAVFNIVENALNILAPETEENEIKQAARALWGGVHGICVVSLSGSRDLIRIEDVEDTITLLVRNFIKGWLLTNKKSSFM